MIEQRDEGGALGALLDTFIFFLKNKKALIYLPLIAGLVAYCASYALPSTYVSEAVIHFHGEKERVGKPRYIDKSWVNPIVFDALIKALDTKAGTDTEKKRVEMRASIKFSVDRDHSIRVSASAFDPANAQKKLMQVLDVWLGLEMRSADVEVARNGCMAHARDGTLLLEHLFRKVPEIQMQTSSYVFKEEEKSLLLNCLKSNKYPMLKYNNAGISPEFNTMVLHQIILKPTLPSVPISPKRGVIGVFAVLTIGFLSLLWVVCRNVWREAMRLPKFNQKLRELRDSLGIKNKNK